MYVCGRCSDAKQGKKRTGSETEINDRVSASQQLCCDSAAYRWSPVRPMQQSGSRHALLLCVRARECVCACVLVRVRVRVYACGCCSDVKKQREEADRSGDFCDSAAYQHPPVQHVSHGGNWCTSLGYVCERVGVCLHVHVCECACVCVVMF